MVMKTNIFRLLFVILVTSWDASGCYAQNFSDSGVGNGYFWSWDCSDGISRTHGCSWGRTRREHNLGARWFPWDHWQFILTGRGLCGT